MLNATVWLFIQSWHVSCWLSLGGIFMCLPAKCHINKCNGGVRVGVEISRSMEWLDAQEDVVSV